MTLDFNNLERLTVVNSGHMVQLLVGFSPEDNKRCEDIALGTSDFLKQNVIKFTDVFCLLHLNVQWTANKIDDILLFLHDNDVKYDILCFSEHWLKAELKMINLNNFKLASYFCRKELKNDGVAAYVAGGVEHITLDLSSFCSEQDAKFCGILLKKTKTVVVCLYRSCLGNYDNFIVKLTSLMDYLVNLMQR